MLVYLDASGVSPSTGQSSNIIGLGQPKGFAKPTVGMKIHQGALHRGMHQSIQFRTRKVCLKN